MWVARQAPHRLRCLAGNPGPDHRVHGSEPFNTDSFPRNGIALNEVLGRFGALDPAKAELVTLRYLVGLTLEQAAPIFGISEPTPKRRWAPAEAWLYRKIQRDAAC